MENKEEIEQLENHRKVVRGLIDDLVAIEEHEATIDQQYEIIIRIRKMVDNAPQFLKENPLGQGFFAAMIQTSLQIEADLIQEASEKGEMN